MTGEDWFEHPSVARLQIAGPRPACWLGEHGRMERGAMPACDGRLRKAHLIRRQVLEREAPDADPWDPRVWVFACGGPMGNAGHHGMLDAGHRLLRIPRDAIPPGTEAFAAEHGLTWWLDREYGPSNEENA
jgi:hypothetical protein